jgi:rhamnosyltransferase
VVGAHISPRVRRFHGRDGVTVVGTVPDLRPYYHRHSLMVAPIRAGSGTRLKILEAFASGLPVVSTTLGAEGIACADERHLLLADPPAAFARAVVRLLDDAGLGERLAREAMALAAERYDWRASAEALLAAYRELVPPAATPAEGAAPPAGAARRPARRRPTATGSAAARAAAGEGAGAGTGPRPRPAGVSVIIPTWNGGERLEAALEAIFAQRCDRDLEVLLIDSGSSPRDLARMSRFPVRIEPIDRAEFNHGLTRDLGAELSRGEVLVFLNQDAVPCDDRWLAQLTDPLFADGSGGVAAVQGGIRELPDPGARFYWDSCGQRFYFTRESDRWIDRFEGIGFSTVNAAIRRSAWERHPFGWAPIMEDKKWQREVVDAGYAIRARPEAAVFHTHNYDLRGLIRRCRSEGFGWRLLGEPYRLADMLRDMLVPRVYRDLVRGLSAGRIRSPAELFFPVLRPLMVYRGNRWSREVEL